MFRRIRRFSIALLPPRKNPTDISLVDLPNEIIIMIASHLNNKSLKRLILTGRYLSQLLQGHLYGRVDTGIPEPFMPSCGLYMAPTRKGGEAPGRLFDLGARIKVNHIDGDIPLHLAARAGYSRVVKFFMEREDADKAAMTLNGDGFSPLHVAAQHGHVEVLKVILEKGINPNHSANVKFPRNQEPYHSATALYYAALLGEEAAVAVLLENGAGVDYRAQNRENHTPLHWVAMNYHSLPNAESIIKMLLANGADATLTDSLGRNALHIMPMHAEAQTKLPHEHIGMHIVPKPGRRKLASDRRTKPVPIKKSHEIISALMLEHGVGIDAQSTIGRTPLHYAVTFREEYIIDNLLDLGADINKKTVPTPETQPGYKDSKTPIFLAIGDLYWYRSGGRERSRGVIKLLVKRGAALDIKNSDGQTPIDTIRRRVRAMGEEELVRLMQEFAT